jgi:hypothetical protein
MSTVREDHSEAGLVAISRMDEALGSVGAALEKVEEAAAAARNAVGDSNVASGLNSLSALQGSEEKLNEVQGMLVGSMAEMERYNLAY